MESGAAQPASPTSGVEAPEPPPQWQELEKQRVHDLVEDKSDTLREFDRKLCEVLDCTGWPYWHTTGEGDKVPRRRDHDFRTDCLKDGARIDCLRGADEDDWTNDLWIRRVSRSGASQPACSQR